MDKALASDPRPLGLAAELHKQKARAALLGVAPEAVCVGRYALRELLGEGAMGQVFLAWDPTLDREVALKIVESEGGSLKEARSLARLSHPNVVHVYEAGECEHGLFLAMERVRGHSLDRWLRELREEPTADLAERRRRLLSLFLKIGEGLWAIHREGLIHRDFKPENVLVDEEGRPRVADLGLAIFETEPSSFAGTPRYMAPEQRSGEGASAQSDLYSFCLSLREALEESEPPAELRALLERGLREAPKERWASMEALLSALRPFARPAPTLFRREPLWLARTILAIGLSVPLLWLFAESLGAVPARDSAWLLLSGAQLTLFGAALILNRRRFVAQVSDPRFLIVPLGVLAILLSHRLLGSLLGAPVALSFTLDYATLAILGLAVGGTLERAFFAPASVASICLFWSLLEPSHAPRLWALFIALGPPAVFLIWRRRARGKEGGGKEEA